MITIEIVQAAYPVFTGLTWTTEDTTYFYPIAYERVMSDLPNASDEVKVQAICYYIASLHEGAKGTVAVSSESLGDYSYTRMNGAYLDSWLDRYNAIIDNEGSIDPLTGALGGIENPEVPEELRLDRWC